ncbi:ATP-binding cassette domain-containing protein [Enterococcus lactis]|nr:ATP-binding cassette domain-containing protein [Enterococcus lactis]
MMLHSLFEVGLSNVLEKKIYELSGGEQQRIALARLILKNLLIFLQMNLQVILMKKMLN